MREIVMVGPADKVQGGISSVIHAYRESEIFKENKVHYVAAFIESNLLHKILFFGWAAAKFTALMFNKRIQIVHVHSATRGSFLRKSILLLIAKAFGKKVIMHVHGAEFNKFYDKSDYMGRRYIRAILSRSVVVALSESWKRDLTRMVRPGTEIYPIYNPVVIPSGRVARDKHAEVRFLFLGRIGNRKGVYDLIKAAGALKTKNVRIIIAGDGDVDKAKDLVAKEKLDGKVTISGWVSGKPKEDLLNNSDVFILPSYHEGLPMSILEAMAHKLPVISTKVGGIPEAVTDGINGIIIKPGDYKALARAIEKLAQDRDLRNSMAEQSLKIAKEKFDLKKIAKQVNGLYAKLEK